MDNDNTAVQYAPLWVSEPNKRGTWSILYSCVFTLSICVWSAIHLNIPPKGERESYQYWRKTKWVFIAIFAPEVVLYSAWQQFYLARRFSREMQNVCRGHYNMEKVDTRAIWEKWLDNAIDFIRRRVFPEDWQEPNDELKLTNSKRFPEPSGLDDVEETLGVRKHRKESKAVNPRSQDEQDEIDKEIASFSMTYGFYVIMGGFVVNTSDIYDHEKAQWLTVTARGVIEFAKTLPWDEFRAHFSIDEGQIKDKSKADCLTKILVIFQVVWAALNSLSRVVLDYPITVLEVHTLVHAACAMMMYVLWFKKPLDIRDPNPINTAAFRDRMALMLVRSPGSAYAPYVDFKLPTRWQLYRYWPSERNASESSFLMFSASYTTAGVHHDVYTTETYSIMPQLPDVPLVPSAPSDSRDSDDQPDGTAELARIESDIFTAETPRNSGWHPSAFTLATRTDMDRMEEQADLEAKLSVELQPPRVIPTTFKMADLCRMPPKRREKNTKVRLIDSIFGKGKLASDRPLMPVTLTTGEFLASGIGPAGLLTYTNRSNEQKTYERYSARITKRMPIFKPLLDRLYLPTQAEIVEIDERLRPFIAFPKAQWWENNETGELEPPNRADLDDAHVHKISAALSYKDVTRWTRACRAFRVELEEAGELDSRTKLAEESEKSREKVEKRSTKPSEDDLAPSPTSPEDATELESPPKLVSLWKRQESSDADMFDQSAFCDRSPNFNGHSLSQLSDKSLFLAMYVAMSYISSIYAGIHLALWNHDFPTTAESILWKISGITLGVPAPIFVIFNCFLSICLCRWPYLVLKKAYEEKAHWCIQRLGEFCYHGLKKLIVFLRERAKQFIRWLRRKRDAFDRWWEAKYEASKAKNGFLSKFWDLAVPVVEKLGQGLEYSLLAIFYVVFFGPLFGGGILYIFSRVYIVAESFLSLRHVPVGVYEEVSWAQYIPHL